MNWLKDLIEPNSGKSFTISKASLETETKSIKIEDNIPIFRPDLNFEDHWENNATEDIPKPKLNEARKFLSPIFDQFNHLGKRKILDAGCGDGIHLTALTNQFSSAQLYGIDISLAGLKLSQSRLPGQVHLIQASIDQLPFPNDYFDIIYSYGVIAYTPSPKRTFSELVKKTKQNGVLGIWIFPRAKGIAGILFRLIRGWCQLTGNIGTALVANLIVPFMSFLPTRSKLTLKNASWKQCREIVMVNIAPSTLFFPEHEEIEDWFKEYDMDIIHIDRSNPISIWGKKK